jgi:hypothetical protein
MSRREVEAMLNAIGRRYKAQTQAAKEVSGEGSSSDVKSIIEVAKARAKADQGQAVPSDGLDLMSFVKQVG